MSKNTTTIAVSVPVEVVEAIDTMAKDLHVSRSALATAVFSMLIKWDREGEVLKNAIQGR